MSSHREAPRAMNLINSLSVEEVRQLQDPAELRRVLLGNGIDVDDPDDWHQIQAEVKRLSSAYAS